MNARYECSLNARSPASYDKAQGKENAEFSIARPCIIHLEMLYPPALSRLFASRICFAGSFSWEKYKRIQRFDSGSQKSLVMT